MSSTARKKTVKRPGLFLDLSLLLIIWQNQHCMQTNKQAIKASLSSQHHDKPVIKSSSSSHYRCTLIHNLQALEECYNLSSKYHSSSKLLWVYITSCDEQKIRFIQV